jgi:hypothetical protein
MAFDSYWLNEPYTAWRLDGLKLFIEHTIRHHSNDVYFVRHVDIINWMKQPVGLKRMKQGYLAELADRFNCADQHRPEMNRALINDDTVTTSSNTTHMHRSLLILFDAVSEPLFRSNIVFYSILSFFLFILVTFIYDRLSAS